MPAIVVTSEQLTNLGTQVSGGAGNIQTELTKLKHQVDTVVGEGWQGAASTQFNTLYTEWQTSAQNLHQALEGISKLLTSAASSYQTNEDNIKTSFGTGQ